MSTENTSCSDWRRPRVHLCPSEQLPNWRLLISLPQSSSEFGRTPQGLHGDLLWNGSCVTCSCEEPGSPSKPGLGRGSGTPELSAPWQGVVLVVLEPDSCLLTHFSTSPICLRGEDPSVSTLRRFPHLPRYLPCFQPPQASRR